VKRMPIWMLVVLASASPAVSQTVDKEKLRAAAYLPWVNSEIKLGTDALFLRDADGKKTDFALKIDELEKQLDGTLQDAQVYLKLAGYHKDKARRLQAARKAEELLRPHLQTTDPTKGRLLAEYSQALSFINPDDLKAQEKWAAQATRLSPQDWHGWLELGFIRRDRFLRMLYGSDDKATDIDKAAEFDSLDKVFAELLQRKLPAATLGEAGKHLEEAQQCYDKVRSLGARDEGALLACVRYDTDVKYLGQMLARLRGQNVCQTSRDSACVRDLFALAELCPENMPCQGNAAVWQLKLALHDAGKSDGFAPEVRQALQKYLDRLARGAEGRNAEGAAFCSMPLASLDAVLGDLKASETHTRRALERDSSLVEVWEFLTGCLHVQGRHEEALEVSRACLKRFPTSRNHFILAKGLVKCGRAAEAEPILRDGLKADPDDLYCTLGLVAVLILGSDKADTLPEAGQRLETATRQLRPMWSRDVIRDLAAMTIIYEGLTDKADKGRSFLRNMLASEPETPELRKIREALSP
jgi:tetratricopeptide (TPR) repeat protein